MQLSSRSFSELLFLISYFSSLFKFSKNEEFQQKKFNSMEVKVLAMQFPPIFSYKKQKDGNYTFSGLGYELMEDVKNDLELKYKYVVVDETQVTKHGLIRALITYLDRKQVDIVPYMFDQDLNNLKHMELASTVWIDPLALLQPWPEEESRLEVVIRPFQTWVWILFFVSTVIFIISTTMLIIMQERCDNANGNNNSSIRRVLYKQFEYVLTIIASQGNSIPYQSWTTLKIVVGFWLISMVVLIYAYTGVMTALLSVPKLEPIANTVEEAVLQKRLFTMENETPVSRMFLIAEEGYEKDIGDQLRKDPTFWSKDPLESLDNVVHRKCAYPTSLTMSNYMIYEDTKANDGRCRLTVSAELIKYNQLPFQVGFQPGSQLAPAFNIVFLRVNAAGIIDLYKKKYFPSTKQCRTDVPPETKTQSLTLVEFGAAFVILGVGLTLSLLAFMAEIISKYLTRAKFCPIRLQK